MTSSTRLPLIDMSGIREGDPTNIRRAGNVIRKACSEIDFFYIINHGVPQTVIDTAMTAAEEFFAYPVEVKRQAAVNNWRRDWHVLGGATMYDPTYSASVDLCDLGIDRCAESVAAGDYILKRIDDSMAYRKNTSAESMIHNRR